MARTTWASDDSRANRRDLSRAKSAMSARYLGGQVAVHGLARALRAAPSSARTHNIVGVGIDEKYVDGFPTGVSVVKFLVKTKMPLTALTSREKLPKFVDGIPTDVRRSASSWPRPGRRRRKRHSLLRCRIPACGCGLPGRDARLAFGNRMTHSTWRARLARS